VAPSRGEDSAFETEEGASEVHEVTHEVTQEEKARSEKNEPVLASIRMIHPKDLWKERCPYCGEQNLEGGFRGLRCRECKTTVPDNDLPFTVDWSAISNGRARNAPVTSF
jgi:tRNA(Ile2) C34 agmatinyltransferase TiaS